MKNFLKIGDKKIGKNFKPFIICELGINHNGSLKLAKKMVDLAYKAGADAIKNQRHILDKEMIPEAKKIKPSNADISIYDVIKKTLMSFDDEKKLKKYVENKKLIYLSTPFSLEAANQLNKINVTVFRLDIENSLSSFIDTSVDTENFFENSFVNKKRKFRLIKKGILGNNGDVIVDDVIKPKRIIGVCGKDGFLKNISIKDYKSIKKEIISK